MTTNKQNPFRMSEKNMDKFIKNFGKNSQEIFNRIDEMRFNKHVRQ